MSHHNEMAYSSTVILDTNSSVTQIHKVAGLIMQSLTFYFLILFYKKRLAAAAHLYR